MTSKGLRLTPTVFQPFTLVYITYLYGARRNELGRTLCRLYFKMKRRIVNHKYSIDSNIKGLYSKYLYTLYKSHGDVDDHDDHRL